MPVIILQMERLVLTNQSNRIECTVLNSPFAKLSLWHYKELLLETNKTHLEYLLPPYQFGQFTCQFTSGSNSSLVREKGGENIKIFSGIVRTIYLLMFGCYSHFGTVRIVTNIIVSLDSLQLLIHSGCCITDEVCIACNRTMVVDKTKQIETRLW